MRQVNKMSKVKNKPLVKQVKVNEDNELVKLIKITVIVLLLIIIFAGITWLIVNKKSNDSTSDDTSIQYKEILVGSILNYSGDYYVLVTSSDDSDLSSYTTDLDSSKVVYYKVYLDNAFNRSFLSDSANLYVSSVKDIRFKETTLLYISDGVITNAYEGFDAIDAFLGGLSS